MAGSVRSLARKIPSYTHHKATGQARVRIDGHDHYLGKYGSVESREAYGRLIAEKASGCQAKPTGAAPIGFTINEVALAFLLHAEKYYVKNGEITSEYDCYKSAIRPLVELYGDTLAGGEDGFSAAKLSAVRDQMIDLGWSRRFINKSCGRIRKIFKWANVREMLGTKLMGYHGNPDRGHPRVAPRRSW